MNESLSSGCWRIICRRNQKLVSSKAIIVCLKWLSVTFRAGEAKASRFDVLGCVVSAAVGTFQSYKMEFHRWLLDKEQKYHMQLERTRLEYSNKTNVRWFIRWFRCQFDKWHSISWKLKSNQIFNSLWSNHCKRCPQYCSRAILERVNFVLVYRDNPIVWSYRSLMFDKLDTRNDLMPAEL